MKKIILPVLIAATACFGLVGCNADDREKPQVVTYTVTFDSQGGSEVGSQQVLSGNPVKRPDTPEREGYFLNGWYTSSYTSADSEWHFDTDRVTKDITLYAGWTAQDEIKPTDKLIYKREGGGYTVTGMTGEDTVIVIPAEHDGLPVTKIQGDYGNGAFARKAITKVTIPDSIIEIGQNSFHNCSSLRTVIISTTSKLTTIGNNAFSGNYALTEMFIPSGMTNLGNSVFNNCGGIERFIVAEDNEAYDSANGHLIEKATHSLIRGASSGEIPSGVKTVCSAAFRKSMASELVIPSSVEKIENYIVSDSAIQKIKYRGTAEDWEKVSKAKLWNMGKTDIEVEFIQEEVSEMYITVNGNKLKVTLEDNSSVAALVEILKQGDIVFTATENGGFEIYGNIGHTLPTNNTQITAQAGDVILYAGNNICLFFGSNSWSYTRIGKINGYTSSELKAMLGALGSVQVTLSLA